MADKTWVVSHARAREPITVTGKDLEEALLKEGLDPNIWKPITPEEPGEIPPGEPLGDKPDST
ncbi:hypothetical protein ES703_105911 [subsurface metagenome]